MRTMYHLARLVAVLLVVPGILFTWGGGSPTEAHHYHHGHTSPISYLWPPLSAYEMNNMTATGQSIPITATTTDTNWMNALNTARNNWNSGMYSTTGFNVYSSGGDYVTVESGDSESICGTGYHGCVRVPRDWNAPSGPIYMYSPAFTSQDHRVSDLMHEMGHVLYYANEHYNNGWDCGTYPSIMCHSYLTAVQPHDIEDYKAAYEVREGPNATYIWIPNLSDATHYWESGYLSGNGYTIHQEKYYWIDRSTTGVNGTYSTYVGLLRIVNNSDDTTANSWADPATYPIPWPNAEWCFKARGEAGGVPTSNPYHWGPMSKAYCVSTAFSPPPGTCGTSSVVMTSDRNSKANFRVFNFSGGTITNVVITKTDNTYLCELGNITNGNSKLCSKTLSGSGTVRLYYNGTWGYCDSIQYGG